MQSMSKQTKGGLTAHWIRRFLHVSIIVFPILYYYFLLNWFSLASLKITLISLGFLIILFEMIRVRVGFIFFAQRLHEATHFSALGWTLLSLCLVFLFSPSVGFSFAIIGSCAVVDPLVGEMRERQIATWKIVCAGIGMVLLIWLIVAHFYAIAYGWAFLMAPLIIAAEWPSLKWIDDNALMMLVPLIIVGVSA